MVAVGDHAATVQPVCPQTTPGVACSCRRAALRALAVAVDREHRADRVAPGFDDRLGTIAPGGVAPERLELARAGVHLAVGEDALEHHEAVALEVGEAVGVERPGCGRAPWVVQDGVPAGQEVGGRVEARRVVVDERGHDALPSVVRSG